MKKILSKLHCIWFDLFYRSIWGVVIVHMAWDKYKKSALYEERLKHFGRQEAAKMFSVREWHHFKEKVLRDWRCLLAIYPWPFNRYDLYEKDAYDKRLVNFEQ